MSTPVGMLQRTLVKYQESVAERQRQLDVFRQEAEQYVRDLSEEIRKYEETIGVLQSELDASLKYENRNLLAPAVGRDERDSLRNPRPRSVNVGGVLKESQSQLIRREAAYVLEQHDRPLKQTEIKQALEERGVQIVSADPVELIRAALRRAPGFRHIPREGYVLSRPVSKSEGEQ